MGRGRLEEALERLGRRWRAGRLLVAVASQTPQVPHVAWPPQISLSPGCAYGVRYAQALEDLQKDVAELKTRLNGLLFLLAGAVTLEVVMRLVR